MPAWPRRSSRDGLPAFVDTWYQQPMWQSLRAHARWTSRLLRGILRL